jgi:hypothetical protein
MKLFLIVVALLLSTTTQAQDTIKIPAPVAKQIVLDLISGDSAKAELELTQQQLILTNKVVVLKDSIISSYIQKCNIYDERITNEQAKFNVQSLYVNQLEKSNKKLKVKLAFTKIVSIAVAGSISYFYLIK